MTRMVRRGLELSVVALPDVGHMPAGEDEQEAPQVFYAAETRATPRLTNWVGMGE